MATLTFAGAAGTVTGSRFLLRTERARLLLDCGLFQGPASLRRRNTVEPGFDPRAIDAVVLSHAHLDHSGYLPVLVRRGFTGAIHCSRASIELLELVLHDAARLQEEDARRAAQYGDDDAEPLFTTEDVELVLRLARPHAYGETFPVAEGVTALLRRAGHILGSATVEVQLAGTPPTTLVFSGDLGRPHHPMLRPPEPVTTADVLLVESTYGDRRHAPDPLFDLAEIVSTTAARGGVVVIPAFAIGRTQDLLWHLRTLEDAGRIPSLPVYVDSPMAIDATELFCRYPEDHNIDMAHLMDRGLCPLCCRRSHFVRDSDASRRLVAQEGPMIVIAGSGMVTGGRVLHHLARRLPEPENAVLLAGFQAAGTRGRELADGAESVRIRGRSVPVRARVASVHGLSAHADADEIMGWLRGFSAPPRAVHVVHGEPPASAALAARISAELGWRASVAEHGSTVDV